MKTKVINISIPNNLLNEADKIAQDEYRNRSELFREALRNYILAKKNLSNIYQYGGKQTEEQGVEQKDINQLISNYRKGK